MRRIRIAVAGVFTLILLASSARNAAAQEPFLGEVRFVAFTFAPRGWAECNGQLLSISQNTALFSLLGTTYGGNGQTTFALPDLRGRMPMHAGQGAGLTNREQGESAGSQTATLTVAQLPAHTHGLQGVNTEANAFSPTGNLPATKQRVTMYAAGPPDTTMSPQAIAPTGSSQPLAIMPPYLVLRCIIATEGIFPSRP
jgi:microcystin-dependent protein